MTVIAWRDGVMAADSGVWVGDACHPWADKLAVGPDGTLYGVCGNAAECETFRRWVVDGCAGDRPQPKANSDGGNSFIVLMAPPGKPVEILTKDGVERFDAPYIAIGGGAATAYGALWAGASAALAVEAAIAHGQSAMGKVQSIRWKGEA